jgi:ABC-type arginine transport system ATPase subunit
VIAIKNLEIGKSSNVWNLHLEPRLETRKAIVKARMMTGSYILQIDKHKLNNNSIEFLHPEIINFVIDFSFPMYLFW